MKPVEIGQVVHISTSGMFLDDGPKLSQDVVVKLNNSSFYTCPINEPECRFPTRYDRKRWAHNTGFGYTQKAYETEEEYWNMIELRNEKDALQKSLTTDIKGLSLTELRAVNGYIKRLMRG